MQRFSRQNWSASHCRKRARPGRKAGRRAFRLARFGRWAAPGGGRGSPTGVSCARALVRSGGAGGAGDRETGVREAGFPPVGATTPALRLRVSARRPVGSGH